VTLTDAVVSQLELLVNGSALILHDSHDCRSEFRDARGSEGGSHRQSSVTSHSIQATVRDRRLQQKRSSVVLVGGSSGDDDDADGGSDRVGGFVIERPRT
jgi:hypothetical protein